MGGKIELWRSEKDRQWRVRVKAGNGRILVASEGYQKRQSALNMIRALVHVVAEGAAVGWQESEL